MIRNEAGEYGEPFDLVITGQETETEIRASARAAGISAGLALRTAYKKGGNADPDSIWIGFVRMLEGARHWMSERGVPESHLVAWRSEYEGALDEQVQVWLSREGGRLPEGASTLREALAYGNRQSIKAAIEALSLPSNRRQT